MTLRCPKCGSKRLIFLSTTDGFAVGSTDQRYLCKDCDYRGSVVIEEGAEKKKRKKAEHHPLKRSWKILLYALDLVLFLLVLAAFATGNLETDWGFAILTVWVVVFLISIAVFASQVAEGSEQWFRQGIHMMTGVLIVFTLGIFFNLDSLIIIILLPIAAAVVYLMEWITTDNSDEEFKKDLEELSKKIH